MKNSKRQWGIMVAVALVAALVAAPTAVWASHQFLDVPNDDVFHDDIDAIADAGVTIGCNPPDNTLYCPNNNVTRGQMAAFMNRLGSLDGASTPSVDARSVGGLGLYADIVEVDVNNAENNNEECEPTESLLGPDHAFGTFYTAYQLLDVPEAADFFTFDVNVSTSDRDPNDDLPASGFLVCFATVDGGELPDGTYRLFRMEAHELAPASD